MSARKQGKLENAAANRYAASTTALARDERFCDSSTAFLAGMSDVPRIRAGFPYG
jgi:hypothetical protein